MKDYKITKSNLVALLIDFSKQLDSKSSSDKINYLEETTKEILFGDDSDEGLEGILKHYTTD